MSTNALAIEDAAWTALNTPGPVAGLMQRGGAYPLPADVASSCTLMLTEAEPVDQDLSGAIVHARYPFTVTLQKKASVGQSPAETLDSMIEDVATRLQAAFAAVPSALGRRYSATAVGEGYAHACEMTFELQEAPAFAVF